MKARTKSRATKGFALIEVLIAVLFVGVFLMALLQIRNQALHQFLVADDQFTGSWLAEWKMAELISQDLPDPEDDATWEFSDYGDFREFDDRTNAVNRAYNEEWTDRNTFARFEFEWTKELIFIGPDFIGSALDLDAWEQPVDAYGDLDTSIEDPREQPAARVVRITLVVYLPERRGQQDEDGSFAGRKSIKLVTYVDPNVLFKAQADTDDPTNLPSGGR